jgi:hypothetical protein
MIQHLVDGRESGDLYIKALYNCLSLPGRPDRYEWESKGEEVYEKY